MKRRAGRIALLVVFVAALAGAAGFWAWIERSDAAARATAAGTDASVRRLLTALARVGPALPAATAGEQSDPRWRTRVSESLEAAKVELGELRRQVTEPASLNDLDAAAAAVDDLAAVAERAARLVRNGQASQASAVVLGDGVGSLELAWSRVQAALVVQQQAEAARERARRLQQAAAATGAGVVGLLALALLLPAAAPRRSEESHETPSLLNRSGHATTGDAADRALALDDAPLHATIDTAMDAAGPMNSEPGDPAATRPDRRRATELKAMADLCTDFGRLGDSGELPGLLERTARLIDAAGFIVWVADPASRELRPTLAQGYPAESLARLPRIPRDADNATAAAWRNAELQVVTTNGMTPGAIVVPLLTSSGCIGALSAEVRHGRESSESTRALARIAAAQVATLVHVPALEQQPAEPATEHQEHAHG